MRPIYKYTDIVECIPLIGECVPIFLSGNASRVVWPWLVWVGVTLRDGVVGTISKIFHSAKRLVFFALM